MTKDELLDLKTAYTLIKMEETSVEYRVKKLNTIADLCKVYDYGDDAKKQFVMKSLEYLNNGYINAWVAYLKKVLLYTEEYEALGELKL